MKEKSKNEKEIYVFNDEDRELMKMYRLDEERYLEFVRFQDSQYTSLRMTEEIEAINLSNQRIAGDLHWLKATIENPFKQLGSYFNDTAAMKMVEEYLKSERAVNKRTFKDLRKLMNIMVSDIESKQEQINDLYARLMVLEEKELSKSHGSSDSNEKGGVLN